MKNLSKYLNYLIISILVFYGIFYFFQSQFKTQQRDSASQKGPSKAVDVDSIVNKFMKQTADQTIHDQYNTQMAIKKQMNQPIKITKSDNEVHPEDIPAEKQIHHVDHTSESPAEIVRQELFEKEMQLKSDQQERQEYARQYIENARRGGYHLVLSEDLKVISVTPIRKPSQDDDSVESFPAD